MRGKVIKKENTYYIEYLTESNESDAVEKSQVRLTLIDHRKVMEGMEVDFEIRSFYTVDGSEIATLK